MVPESGSSNPGPASFLICFVATLSWCFSVCLSARNCGSGSGGAAATGVLPPPAAAASSAPWLRCSVSSLAASDMLNVLCGAQQSPQAESKKAATRWLKLFLSVSQQEQQHHRKESHCPPCVKAGFCALKMKAFDASSWWALTVYIYVYIYIYIYIYTYIYTYIYMTSSSSSSWTTGKVGGVRAFAVLPCLLVRVFCCPLGFLGLVYFSPLSVVLSCRAACPGFFSRPQFCWNLVCCPFLFCRSLFGGNFPDKFNFCVKFWFLTFFVPLRMHGFLVEFSTCISVSVSCGIDVMQSRMGFQLRLGVSTCMTFTLVAHMQMFQLRYVIGLHFLTCSFSCPVVTVSFGTWCEP